MQTSPLMKSFGLVQLAVSQLDKHTFDEEELRDLPSVKEQLIALTMQYSSDKTIENQIRDCLTGNYLFAINNKLSEILEVDNPLDVEGFAPVFAVASHTGDNYFEPREFIKFSTDYFMEGDGINFDEFIFNHFENKLLKHASSSDSDTVIGLVEYSSSGARVIGEPMNGYLES